MNGQRVRHGHRRGFVAWKSAPESIAVQATQTQSQAMTMDESINFIDGAHYSQIVLNGADKDRPLPWILAHGSKLCTERGAHGFFYQQHNNGHEIIGFYQTEVRTCTSISECVVLGLIRQNDS